ncbi:hypothetical protein KCU77_g1250, partial [Aureobasidium melanogenum]
MADAKLQLPLRISKQPRRRRFRAPVPPEKPSYIREKHWSKFSSRLAAELKSDKSGFDVKLLEHSNPTACKLGPPSNAPDYPHHLEKYGMQVLEAAGFLNHKDEGVSALLLASAILDDPVTLSFFYAMAMPTESMDTVSHATAGLTADCKIMKIPHVLPEGEEWAAYLKVDLMTLYIRDWGFEDGLSSFAYTARYQDYEGKFEDGYGRKNTFASYVRLDSAFMRVLEYFDAAQNSNDDKYSRIFDDIQTMAGIPATHRAPISHASAIYRTYFILAATLLHELAHAFSYAYVERPNKEGPYDDPWVPGDTCNELGFAFENYVFGGVVEAPKVNIPPMNPKFAVDLQSKAAPWGLRTSWQWDVWYCNQNTGTMDTDRKIGEPEPDDRLYPVPQAWTQWLFSDELWTSHIHRYGLQAVRVPRLKDWEIRSHPTSGIGRHRTGEDRWNTGEPRPWTQTWD